MGFNNWTYSRRGCGEAGNPRCRDMATSSDQVMYYAAARKPGSGIWALGRRKQHKLQATAMRCHWRWCSCLVLNKGVVDAFKGSFYKESRASQTANSERHDGLVPVGLVSKASMRASTPCRQLPITGATKPRAVYIAVTCVRIWPRGRRDRQGFPNKPPSRTEVAEG